MGNFRVDGKTTQIGDDDDDDDDRIKVILRVMEYRCEK